MTAWKVWNQSRADGLLWKMSSNVKYTQFVLKRLETDF